MSKIITIINATEIERKWPNIVNLEKIDLVVKGDDGMSVSDGFHTFDELYDHRITLFIALCKVYAETDFSEWGRYCPDVWRSKFHSDGELAFGGNWFVLGINKAKGEQITYHLPIGRWDETEFAETIDKAPIWDGHTADDVLQRLKLL